MDRPATSPPTPIDASASATTRPLATPPPPPADRTPFQPVIPRPPGSVAAATWLWVAAAVAGLAAGGLAVVGADARRSALARSLLAGDPSRSAAQTAQVASVAVTAALVWLVALAVLTTVLLVPARRSARAAIALVVAGIAQLAATAIVPALLSAPGWGAGAMVRWVLLGQAVLVGAAVVVTLLPTGRAWRRR